MIEAKGKEHALLRYRQAAADRSAASAGGRRGRGRAARRVVKRISSALRVRYSLINGLS
jgi:hypothetical protein